MDLEHFEVSGGLVFLCTPFSGTVNTPEQEEDQINELMTTLFVEQPRLHRLCQIGRNLHHSQFGTKMELKSSWSTSSHSIVVISELPMVKILTSYLPRTRVFIHLSNKPSNQILNQPIFYSSHWAKTLHELGLGEQHPPN